MNVNEEMFDRLQSHFPSDHAACDTEATQRDEKLSTEDQVIDTVLSSTTSQHYLFHTKEINYRVCPNLTFPLLTLIQLPNGIETAWLLTLFLFPK